MSLFGSLYTSAGGMRAQAFSTGLISQDIANVTTVGYKGSSARFQDIVRDVGRFSNAEGAGGVSVNRQQHIDKGGPISQAFSNSNIAIVGNGFIPVKPNTNPAEPFAFTRNGSFEVSADGILRNSAGFVLYGATVTDQNTPPDVSTPESLIPVDVTAFDQTAIPTRLLQISMNFDASVEDIDPQTVATPQQLPVNNLAASDTRSFTIVDNAGIERVIRFEFRKIVGPMAHFTSQLTQTFELSDNLVDPVGPTPLIADNDAFTITVGGTTETFELVDTAGTALIGGANEVLSFEDLRSAIDNFGGGNILQANLTPNGQFLVQAINPTDTVTLAEVAGTPLSAVNTLNIARDPGAESAAPDFTFEPEADITPSSTTYPDQADFPEIFDTTTPNPSHWWEITIATDVTTATGIVPTQLKTGLINFDSDGNLNTARDALGNVIDGLIDLTGTPIDFDTTVTGEESGFNIDFGRVSQFFAPTSVIFTGNDGAPSGLRTGIEVSREGYVIANYSNGQTLNLYRLPVATFTAPNQLRDSSGTVFYQTAESGTPTFQGAGEGAAGEVRGASLEQSNVDLTEGFSNLVVSQRAYGLNSQVVQAVNEMTQVASRLKA